MTTTTARADARPVAFDDIRVGDTLILDGHRRVTVERTTANTVVCEGTRSDRRHRLTRARYDTARVHRATVYTVRYDTARGTTTRTATARQISGSVGRVVGGLGSRGEAWNIAVLDPDGDDVTFTFPVFE